MTLRAGDFFLDGFNPAPERKNLLINGNFKVDQRHNHVWTTGVSAGFYTADRWLHAATASTWGHQCIFDPVKNTTLGLVQVVTPPAALTGGTFMIPFWYKFEAQDIFKINTKDMVLSFKMIASVTGQYSVCFRNGPNAKSIVFVFDVLDSGTHSFEFKIPAEAGVVTDSYGEFGADLIFFGTQGPSGTNPIEPGVWEDTGTFQHQSNVMWHQTAGASLRLWDVQLEIGSEATEPEYLLYGETLALCQRYFQESGGITALWSGDTTNGITYLKNHKFDVRMRDVPTMNYFNASNVNFPTSTPVANGVTEDGYSVYKISNNTASGGYYAFYWNADAEL